MPIHEYHCSKCGHTFEEIILGSANADDVRCPECGAKRTERLMSAFSAAGSGKGGDCAPPAGGSGFS